MSGWLLGTIGTSISPAAAVALQVWEQLHPHVEVQVALHEPLQLLAKRSRPKLISP